MRPGPEPALRDLEAAAFAEQDVRRGHAHVLEHDLGGPVGHAVEAEHRQRADDLTPGVSIGTRIIDCWRWRSGLSGSVLPMKMQILQRGSVAPVVYHLCPLMTYSSPSRTIELSMLVASRRGDGGLGHREARADLAGEQRLQPALLLLLRAVARQHFHVAGVGRRAVEDLGRKCERPMISHSGAYSRLVRPAPCSLSGRNRFHRPACARLAASAPRRPDRSPKARAPRLRGSSAARSDRCGGP